MLALHDSRVCLCTSLCSFFLMCSWGGGGVSTWKASTCGDILFESLGQLLHIWCACWLLGFPHARVVGTTLQFSFFHTWANILKKQKHNFLTSSLETMTFFCCFLTLIMHLNFIQIIKKTPIFLNFILFWLSKQQVGLTRPENILTVTANTARYHVINISFLNLWFYFFFHWCSFLLSASSFILIRSL